MNKQKLLKYLYKHVKIVLASGAEFSGNLKIDFMTARDLRPKFRIGPDAFAANQVKNVEVIGEWK